MTSGCPTWLLDDSPADSDAFGAHKRIAEAIADLISQEKGGKAIALTGTWGSGKSTVVRLLKSCLRPAGHAVFVFDTWVHQGDPLGRSFLEALITFLSSPQVGWTGRETWQKDLDRLCRRREETDTTSSPILTVGGKLMAASMLLLPLGYPLFATISAEEKPALPVPGISLWIIGLVISLLPFLVVSVVWLSWRPTWKFWRPEFWTKHRAAHEDDSVLALFVHKSTTVDRSKTIRTPEPTSIEFREIFKRVLADALGRKDRRLVVVMDNLDRIPPDEALAVWSTMRAFFDVQTYPYTPADEGWLQNFWLLVPLDRRALGGLWGQRSRRDNQSVSVQEVPEDASAADGPEEKFSSRQKQISQEDETVAAFVDKSFQIEFRVPPPVLSRWKKYFLEQFGKAFPNHANRKDGEIVYRLFRRIGLPAARPLAPRDIKLFINKLGSLHRQWQDRIPLIMQALYTLCAGRFVEPERDLLRPDFLDPVAEALIDSLDWRRYLAALHYNVEPDVAYQVLIGKEVEESLCKGDDERFFKLINVPEVTTVCDHILEENWRDWAAFEPSVLAHSALVLDKVGGQDNAWSACWSWLVKGIERVSEWNELDEKIGKGILALFSRIPADSREKTARKVVRAFRNYRKITETEESEPTEDAIRNWIDGALEILCYLHDNKFNDLIRDEFRVPGTAGAYIVALRYLGEKSIDDALLRYFVPEIKREEVVKEIVKASAKGGLSEAHSRAVSVMLRVGGEWSWKELLVAINQRLQGSNVLGADELDALVETLLMLVKGHIQEADDRLGTLCQQGHLMHHLYAVQSNPKAAACLILAYMVAFPAGTINSTIGNARSGSQFYQSLLQNPGGSPEIVTELADLCVQLQMPKAPLEAYKKARNLQSLARAILMKIVARDDVEQHLPSDDVVTEWDAICALLDAQAINALVEQLVQCGGLVGRLITKPQELGDGKLYALVYGHASANDRGRLATVLRPMLLAVGKEMWLDEIAEEGNLLRLVLDLVKDRRTIDLGVDFHDALMDHAMKTMVSNQDAPTLLVSEWSRLPQALDEDRRQTFAKNLWDELGNHASRTNLAAVMGQYGEYLLSTTPPDPDEAVRRVCSPIIERNESQEIAWIADFLENKNGANWKEADEATKRDFTDRVKKKLSECDDDDLRPLLERIARAIGLPR